MAQALAVVRGARMHGAGGLLLVSGPAGIGKTALLAEICQQAGRAGLLVAAGKCDRIDQEWPGAPVLALLRAGREPLTSAPEFEELTRMAGEPLLLADRIAAVLEATAAEQPVLIALDDLQWADRTSRFMLRVVVSRLIGLPVVWLLAGRGDLGAELTGPELIRRHHLRLGPLTASDLAAIAQDRLGRVPGEQVRVCSRRPAATRSWRSRSWTGSSGRALGERRGNTPRPSSPRPSPASSPSSLAPRVSWYGWSLSPAPPPRFTTRLHCFRMGTAPSRHWRMPSGPVWSPPPVRW